MKSSYRFALRVLLNIGVLCSIFFLPWWSTLLLIVALFTIAQPYETLFWGLLYDLLYSYVGAHLFPFWGTAFVAACLITAPLIKRRLLLYE